MTEEAQAAAAKSVSAKIAVETANEAFPRARCLGILKYRIRFNVLIHLRGFASKDTWALREAKNLGRHWESTALLSTVPPDSSSLRSSE